MEPWSMEQGHGARGAWEGEANQTSKQTKSKLEQTAGVGRCRGLLATCTHGRERRGACGRQHLSKLVTCQDGNLIQPRARSRQQSGRYRYNVLSPAGSIWQHLADLKLSATCCLGSAAVQPRSESGTRHLLNTSYPWSPAGTGYSLLQGNRARLKPGEIARPSR